jgi:exonuclease VII large subunit
MKLGDVSAGNLTKIHVSSDQAIQMINADVQAVIERLAILERTEVQHIQERQALTRLITQLATEAKTVGDVHDLLMHQLASDAANRRQRQRYLDTMLTSLIVLAFLNLFFHLFRVLRRPAGGEAIISSSRRIL